MIYVQARPIYVHARPIYVEARPIDLLNGERHCTAGFVLRKTSDGAKRMGTAGHCVTQGGGLGAYVNYRLYCSDGCDWTTVSFTWYRFGSTVPDFGLTTTGNFSPYPSFYYAPGQKREVHYSAASRADVGTQLCHQGRTSGQACGPVTDAVANVPTACCQTVVNADHAAFDSGGPWYWGYRAFGIHHGVAPDNNFAPDDAAFSPVHVLANYDLEVWTTS